MYLCVFQDNQKDLEHATEQLSESTNVIFMYLCVFQDNQKDLEHATEQLSEYLERDITSDMLADIKQKVQDKYRWEFMSL